MYSITSGYGDEARAALDLRALEQRRSHRVALLHGPLELRAAAARWERHRDALADEGAEVVMLPSTTDLRRLGRSGRAWVLVIDPDEVSLEELSAIVEPPTPGRCVRSSIVALCSRDTAPSKLCRLFEAGAYLGEKNVSPRVLSRLCSLAVSGGRAPLLRFSEQAGLSGAEQRAFFAECAGLSKNEAADELGCSPRTLETYWSRIFAKLRIRSTDGVVAAALRFAMLETGPAEA